MSRAKARTAEVQYSIKRCSLLHNMEEFGLLMPNG